MASKEDTPVWRWMLPLSFVFINECICLTMLYPFVGYMVYDFGIVSSVDQAGVYAGFIASMFVLGQLCTGSFWGSLSDKYGRGPILGVGLTATAILAPLFGMSQSLGQAMGIRFIMGLMNGNQGVAKAYIGDAVTTKTQALGFSLVAICWGCGNMVGAWAGGVCARPAVSMPHLFGGTIFETYPYLLPCAASSFFATLGLILTQLYLPDFGGKISGNNAGNRQSGRIGPYAYVRSHSRCWYILGIFFWISFLDYGMFEVMPLWAITTIPGGGLSWTTAQVGMLQLLGGGFLLVGNLIIMPWMQKKCSALTLQRFGMVAMCGPGFALLPLAAICCAGTLWAYVAVSPIFFLRITGPGVVFTLCFQFINNMTRDTSLRGAVTGIGQQVGCLARVLSPPIWSKLYAWGNRSTLPFPFDRYFSFVMFGVLWLIPLWLNTRLFDWDVVRSDTEILPDSAGAVPEDSNVTIPEESRPLMSTERQRYS